MALNPSLIPKASAADQAQMRFDREIQRLSNAPVSNQMPDFSRIGSGSPGFNAALQAGFMQGQQRVNAALAQAQTERMGLPSLAAERLASSANNMAQAREVAANAASQRALEASQGKMYGSQGQYYQVQADEFGATAEADRAYTKAQTEGQEATTGKTRVETSRIIPESIARVSESGANTSLVGAQAKEVAASAEAERARNLALAQEGLARAGLLTEETKQVGPTAAANQNAQNAQAFASIAANMPGGAAQLNVLLQNLPVEDRAGYLTFLLENPDLQTAPVANFGTFSPGLRAMMESIYSK